MKKIYFILTLCVIFCQHALAIDVPPGTNNIQAYVNNAAAGSTLNLGAGTFFVSQTVLLNKKITINGAGTGATIIKKSNATNTDIVAFQVTANNVTFKNLTINGDNTGGPAIIVNSQFNSFSNLVIKLCGNSTYKSAGLLFQSAFSNSVTNVTSVNNYSVGISQNNSPSNTITNCHADNNGAEGLTIDLGSDNCKVNGGTYNGNNTKTGGVGGIGIDDSNGAILNGCTVDGTANLSGITFQNNIGPDDGCQIKNCKITNNAQYGVRIRNCTYAVTNSLFSGNTYYGNGLSPNIKWDCGQTTLSTTQKNASVVNNLLVNDGSSSIYPNPANQEITIDFSSFNEPKSIKIFDLNGKILFAKQLGDVKDIIHLNTSDFKNGYYLYQISHEGGETSNKFLVQH